MFGTGKFGEVLNTYTQDHRRIRSHSGEENHLRRLAYHGQKRSGGQLREDFLGDFRTAISWVQALPEEERPNPAPHLNFMDELGSYAVHSLARPFEQGRSAQMALFPAAQTLANLDVVSPGFKEMIIGNTWTKIFFKIGTQATAVECADLIGHENRDYEISQWDAERKQ